MKFLMSKENFIKIFYKENKKGNPLEYRFKEEMKEVRGFSEEIRKKNKKLKEKRETLIKELHLIEKKIPNINIEIEVCPKQIKGKEIYRYKTNQQNNALSIYLIDKQMQNNLQMAFKFRMNNHNKVISQMLGLLNDDMPKYIYRTDIQSFFESIPHNKLKEKINKNSKLDIFTKNTINQILDQYHNLTGTKSGIPRGIGLSSCLAEIYLQNFDHKVRFNKKVFFYSRFVDDIIVFSTESIQKDVSKHIGEIELSHNQDKTREKFKEKGKNTTFEFLGYSFCLEGAEVKVEMSGGKIKKIKARISSAIKDYNSKVTKQKQTGSEARAWKLLNQRLRFLTGNTRLVNIKENVFVGIYYSNPFLKGKLKTLKKLDAFLKRELEKIEFSEILDNRTKSKSLKILKERYSFEKGFNERSFHPFHWKEIKEITKIWKY